MLRRLILTSLTLLLSAISSFAQGGNTTVSAIIKDPTGALYTSSQVNITFVEPTTPGKIPLLNGSTFQKSYSIFATDSFGHFSISLPDTGVIDTSSGTSLSQWTFRVIFSDRQTSFVYVTPINCAANIPTTCTAGAMDITAQLQAVAALLPVTGGGGGGPASATIPMSALSFTPTPTFASTVNAGYKMTLTSNVTSSSTSGTPINGNILAFNLCEDGVGAHTFVFPGTFTIPGTFTFQTAPNVCNYLAFKYDGTNWTFIDTPGSGSGGSTAQPPLNSFQIDAAGVLGGSQYIYNPADFSSNCGLFSPASSCASVTTAIDSSITLAAADGLNTAGFHALSDLPVNPTLSGGGGAEIFSNSIVTQGAQSNAAIFLSLVGNNSGFTGPNGGGCFSGATGTASCARAVEVLFGDAFGNTVDGQDAVGVSAFPAMNKGTGHTMRNIAGFLVKTPLNYTGSAVPVTESAVNLWGVEIQDLQGIGTTSTIGVHVEAQTNPSSHAFAIKTEASAGPSLLTDSVTSTFFSNIAANQASAGTYRMPNTGTVAWRNFGNNNDDWLFSSGAALGNAPADILILSNFSGIATPVIWPTSQASFAATTGNVRFQTGDSLSWRNNANNGNVSLSKNTSDNLVWPNGLLLNSTLLTGGGGGSATFSNVTGTVAELSAFTSNGIPYGNGSNGLLNISAAGGAGTLCFVETNGGAPTWSGCGGSSSTSWSALTNPSADLSLAMGTNNTLFTSGVITGARHAWEFVDGASTSTGSLFNLHTGASSTLKPLTVTAVGTANGIQVSTTGVLAPIGTGHITADQFTGGLTANQLVTSDGSSHLQSVAGSLTGTNPILKLQPSSAANTALTLDTAATPSGDILDININGVKTSWFDNAAVLHTPSATYTGSGPLSLSGTEGTCPATAAGTDIICLGDAATHDAQLSLNGTTFKPMVQAANGSPTSFGVAGWNSTFPQLLSSGAGLAGQAFTSGGSGAFGSYAALNLAGGSTIFTGILPPANGGIGASSLSAANIMIGSGAFTLNDCLKSGGSNLVVDTGSPCGAGGGAPPLHTITAATATNTINSTTFGQIWNWALAGSTTAFKFGENTAATGANNILLQASTAATSTAIPLQADNNGNGYRLSATGLWQPLGTGALATPGAAHNLVVSQAGSSAVTYVPPVAAGKVLIDQGPGADPVFADPVISYNNGTATTAAWTSATTIDTTAIVGLTNPNMAMVLVTLNATSTMTGGTLNFEGDDGSGSYNWAISCTQMAGSLTQTTYALSVSKVAWQCPIAGFSNFRVRLNPAITGSGTANLRITASTAPTEAEVTANQSTAANLNATVVGTVATSNFPATVDVNNGTTSANTPRVTISSDSTGQIKATNLPTTVDVNNGTTSASTLRVTLSSDSTGQVKATNFPTTVDTNNGTTGASTPRFTLSSDSTGQVIPAPTTASGDAVSACNILSAASTNSTNCKGSAGNFYGYEIYNTTITVYYLRLYNSAAAPTCSSATGFIRSIPIPPAGAAGQTGGAVSNQPFPVNYGTGIGYCITGGSSSTDNTNAAVGVFGEIRYK